MRLTTGCLAGKRRCKVRTAISRLMGWLFGKYDNLAGERHAASDCGCAPGRYGRCLQCTQLRLECQMNDSVCLGCFVHEQSQIW